MQKFRPGKLINPKFNKNILKRCYNDKKSININFDSLKSAEVVGKDSTTTTAGRVKERETPLAKVLKGKIQSIGPISISSFINEALTNSEYGYYTKERSDDEIFGQAGDFITSPEFTHLLGDIVGVWCVMQWELLGKPESFRLIELGPGTGSLMNGILRITKKFEEFQKAIGMVHLIDVSPNLIRRQIRTLSNIVLKSSLLAGDSEKKSIFTSKATEVPTVHCSWHFHMEDVPLDLPCIVVAHEFFDALPVYQFQYTDRGWMEKVVVVSPPDDTTETDLHFKYALAPGQNFASKGLSKYINPSVPKKIGSIAEVSPQAFSILEDLCKRISLQKGSALIIDYGEDFPMGFTTQGIRKHQIVSELSLPGETDISSLVDFSSFRNFILSNKDLDGIVNCSRVESQSDFLYSMGIDARVAVLLKNPKLTLKQEQNVIESHRRLTDDMDMGTKFKVLAISSTKEFTGFM